jgi:uncharacterized lipoprotein
MRSILTMAAVAIALGGCAFTPHDLELHPTTNVAPSAVGAGTKVFFRFVDDRDDTVVGFRGAAGQGSKISATNLPPIVEAHLKDGFRAKGYTLLAMEDGADDRVTYRMRSFKFGVETGFWSGSDNVSAVLAVDATAGGKTFSNVYRFNSQHGAMAVPSGDDLDRMMNMALDDILHQALTDSTLDEFLVHGK